MRQPGKFERTWVMLILLDVIKSLSVRDISWICFKILQGKCKIKQVQQNVDNYGTGWGYMVCGLLYDFNLVYVWKFSIIKTKSNSIL